MKISDLDFSDLKNLQLNQISEKEYSVFLKKNENKIISNKILKNFANLFNSEISSKNKDHLIEYFKGFVLALHFF